MSPCFMGLTTQHPYFLNEYTESSSFVSIGPTLNKIQPLKNLKIYGLPDTCAEMSGNQYIS